MEAVKVNPTVLKALKKLQTVNSKDSAVRPESYILLGYKDSNSNEVVLVDEGASTLYALFDKIPEDEVRYILWRTDLKLGVAHSSKFIFISYVPKTLKSFRKALIGSHVAKIKEILAPIHIFWQASDMADLRSEEILAKLGISAGTRVSIFMTSDVPPSFLLGPPGKSPPPRWGGPPSSAPLSPSTTGRTVNSVQPKNPLVPASSPSSTTIAPTSYNRGGVIIKPHTTTTTSSSSSSVNTSSAAKTNSTSSTSTSSSSNTSSSSSSSVSAAASKWGSAFTTNASAKDKEKDTVSTASSNNNSASHASSVAAAANAAAAANGAASPATSPSAVDKKDRPHHHKTPTPAWQKMEKMRGNLAFAPGSEKTESPYSPNNNAVNRSRNASTTSTASATNKSPASGASATTSTPASTSAADATAAAARRASIERKEKERVDKAEKERAEKAEKDQREKEQREQREKEQREAREKERADKERERAEKAEKAEKEKADKEQREREQREAREKEETAQREKEEKDRRRKEQEAEAEALLAVAAARLVKKESDHKRKESDQAKQAKRKESEAKRRESDNTRKATVTSKPAATTASVHEDDESNTPVVIRQSVAHAQAQALQAAKLRATTVRESIATAINTCANCACKGNFRFGREEELTGVKLCAKCDHNVLEHSTISQATFRRDEEERKIKAAAFAEGPRESWASLDNLILYWWKIKEDNPCTAPVEVPREEQLLGGEVVQLTSWMLNVTDRHYAFRFLTEDAKVRMLYMDDRQPPILWWYNILEWDSTKAPTSPASSSDAIARLEAEQEAAAAAAGGGGIASLVTQVQNPDEENEYQARQTDSVSQAANGLYVHDDDD